MVLIILIEYGNGKFYNLLLKGNYFWFYEVVLQGVFGMIYELKYYFELQIMDIKNFIFLSYESKYFF